MSSPLHWQAPDRHSRALPPCGLRNDASLVLHLYDVVIVDLNEPLPLEVLDDGRREPSQHNLVPEVRS